MKIPSYLYEQKMPGVYIIENHTNFIKRYIGSSKDIYNRLHRHKSKLNKNKHENSYLQNAWNKHKENKFECYVVEFVLNYKDEEDLNNQLLKLEQKWIDKLKPEYNFTKKVERNILSKESREKVSKTLKEGYKTGRIKSTSEKAIKVYDLDGNFVKEFQSINKAGKELNINVSSIIRVLKGAYKQTKNYQFKYSTDKKKIFKIEKNRYLRRFS